MIKNHRKRKFKRKIDLERFLLDESFHKTQKEISRLPNFSPDELGAFLTKKGFHNEAIKFVEESVDGGSFIFLMASEEGIEMLELDLKFSKESIQKLKDLYKDIYLFRKRFCKEVEEEERPYY